MEALAKAGMSTHDVLKMAIGKKKAANQRQRTLVQAGEEEARQKSNEMVLNIATCNLCLGLFHKKDYVRNLLYENDIDTLNLQETELEPDIDLNNLNIKGYVLEV
jgi:hypothetical protein